jgi:beta-galactosidase
LATVEHQFFGQWPCITENQYGKGHLIYIGTVPSTDILYRLIARAADRKDIATVERQYRFPIVLRSGINDKGGKLHYLFNYSYEPKTVAYPYPASRSLLDSQKLAQGQNITIEPWGVVIGEEK